MSNFLEKNLRAMQSRQPELLRLLLDTPRDPRFQITRAADGSVVFLEEREGKMVAFSHPAGAAQKAIEFADGKKDCLEDSRPLFFAGIRGGYEVLEMASRLKEKSRQAAWGVYVFEENLDLLHLNFFAFDWSEWIEGGRIFFFAGPKAEDQLSRYFLHDLAKILPRQVIALGGEDLVKRAMDCLARATGRIVKQAERHKKAAEDRYGAIPALQSAAEFFDPAGLRMLLINNKASFFIQYSIRDIAMALEGMGAKVLVLEEKSVLDRLTGPLQLKTLMSFRPHGVFFVDHARHEARDFFAPGLPFFCFMQDTKPEYLDRELAAGVTPYDIFLGNMDYFLSAGYPAGNLFILPGWTNPELFGKERNPPDKRYQTDVAFVSNISTHHARAFDQLSEYYRSRCPGLLPVIRRIYDHALDLAAKDEMIDDWVGFRAWVEELVEEAGIRLPDLPLFAMDIYDRLINAMLRHQALEWVAEAGFSLSLWGRGWEDHPTLGRYARGPAENGDELIDIYRGAKINLHVNQYKVEHPRILDGLAAGGFFLVRKAESVGLLDIKEVSFSNRKELIRRIEHFLPHPELRREIVERQGRDIEKWASYSSILKHTLTHFALLMLVEAWESDEIDPAAGLSEERAGELEKKLSPILDRFFCDPSRLALYAAVESLIVTGRLPAAAAKRLAELDEYQSRWGSPAWPHLFRSRGIKRLRACLASQLSAGGTELGKSFAAVFEKSEIGEAEVAPAYRYAQQDFNLSADQAERVDKLIHEHQELWPDFHADPKTGHESPQAELHRVFIRLCAKRAMAGAMRVLLRYADTQRLNGWSLSMVAAIAEATGRRDIALDFLQRTRDWMEARTVSDPELEQRVLALRILHDMPRHLSDETTEGLLRVENKGPGHWLLNLARARLHILENDWEKALTALGKPSGFPAGDNRRLASQYVEILKSRTRGEKKNAALYGEGRLELVAQFPLPPAGRGRHRIDRLRCLGERYLFLRTIDSEDRVLVFDRRRESFTSLAESLPDAPEPGFYPTFDTRDDGLFLIDPKGCALLEYDKDLRPGLARPLPSMARYYVEDMAVTMDGTVALVDAYQGGIRIGEPGGEWSLKSVPDLRADLPIRLARLGAGFVLYNDGLLRALDREGNVLKTEACSLSVPELYGDEHGVYCVDGYPHRLERRDFDLRLRYGMKALPDWMFFFLSGLGGHGDELFVVDDRRQTLLQLRVL